MLYREVGAEDGIRTRDPLLGKELGLSAVLASSRPEAKGAQLPSGRMGSNRTGLKIMSLSSIAVHTRLSTPVTSLALSTGVHRG